MSETDRVMGRRAAARPGTTSGRWRGAPSAEAPRPPSYTPTPFAPGRLARALFDRLFSHIEVDAEWASAVRAARERGTVVYIARARSVLEFLGIDDLTRRRGLPRIQFTNDLGVPFFQPFGGRAYRREARAVREPAALADTLALGASALLFLRRPPDVAASLTEAKQGRAGATLDVDLVRTLVEIQRTTERPLLLVPQTLVWTKRTPNKQPTLVDVLFGPSDWPGRVRTALQLLFNFQNAIHRGGDPFDLLAFLRARPDLDDARAADAVRYALLRRMERERTIVLGPARKTSARLKDEILRSPRLERHLVAASRESGKSLEAIRGEARRELDRLAADPDPNVVGLMERALDFVWHRIYDGLVVDEAGMARVREAAHRGPLVLVPSHKSHVDYLIVSGVFYEHGLAPPLIAAGDNLAFFPLGAIFRRAGAFFIRRSFKNDKLYPQIVAAYVRKALTEGHNLEVFVEGGRSRTGKLLAPKLGILSMIVDAGLGLSRPIQFVPISIGYERIIEEGSYVRELEGGEKEKEDLGGLLRARRVLRSRYGRLYIQFGEIFDLATLHREALALSGARADEGAPSAPLSPAKRRALISRIAHRVTYEIDRVTMVTPAALIAMALLTHPERGIARADLLGRATELVHAFERIGAPVARALTDGRGAVRLDTLSEAIALFLEARLVVESEGRGSEAVIYAVPDASRLSLEYFKNNVLHFFVPNALVASALRALGWEATMTELRERVRALSRLFKLEFQYRADAAFEDIFADALASMIEVSEVLWEGETIRRGAGRAGARLEIYAEMIRTYLEAYRLALDAIADPRALPTTQKDWMKQALARGRRAHATGALALRESVSKPKLETALRTFDELGIVRVSAGAIERTKDGDAPIATFRALLGAQLAG